MTCDEVCDQALDRSARAHARGTQGLAAELLASVDGPADPDLGQAWQTELDRRAAASDTGNTAGAEWREVRARGELVRCVVADADDFRTWSSTDCARTTSNMRSLVGVLQCVDAWPTSSICSPFIAS